MKHMFVAAVVGIACACGAAQARPLIIGHRGANVYTPENTTVSEQLAWDLNADGIEFDIWLTQDKKLMVMHDRSTSRTGSGVNYDMKKTPSNILANVDIGKYKGDAFNGITIAYLPEMLTYHPKGKVVVVEVKDQPDTIPYLKKDLEATGRPMSEFNIISFQFDTCVEAHKEMPDVEVYFLEGAKNKKTHKVENFTPAILKKAKEAGLSGVDLDYRGVTKELVDKCHEMGMKFYVWTVDDEDAVKKMTKFGVDGITTNRVDWTRRYVDKELGKK